MALNHRIRLLALMAVVVDQVVKYELLGQESGGAVAHTHNTGMSTGAISAPQWFVIAAGLAVITIVGNLAINRVERHTLPVWLPALLIGGAISNLYDRVLTGGVHDVIRVPFVDLNPADLMVFAALAAWWWCSRRRSLTTAEGR
jgi:lipoprotein signal peptidase